MPIQVPAPILFRNANPDLDRAVERIRTAGFPNEESIYFDELRCYGMFELDDGTGVLLFGSPAYTLNQDRDSSSKGITQGYIVLQ